MTPNIALHCRALANFVDRFGREHKTGEEWLVTREDCEAYLPDVYEEVVEIEQRIVLKKGQYCTIINPRNVENSQTEFGSMKRVVGEASFFLQPGEQLEKGIQEVYTLAPDEALVLRAKTDHVDQQGRSRVAGQRWLLCGPTEFCPPLEVEVIGRRKALLYWETFNLAWLFWKS